MCHPAAPNARFFTIRFAKVMQSKAMIQQRQDARFGNTDLDTKNLFGDHALLT